MSKIGERSPSITTAKAKTEQAGSAPKTASAKQLSELFSSVLTTQSATKAAPASVYSAQATQTVTTAQATSATQEVLPSGLGPLRDERLNTCIDEAFRDTFQGERWAGGADRTKWMNFAKDLRAKNPKITAEQVRTAISKELRAQRDGVDAHSSANTDRFIQDAVKWNSGLYQGTERGPSASEMNEWRAFAAKKMAEKPDMSPSDLKNAINDAVRSKMLGTDSAAPANIDTFIQDAVKWNSSLYEGKERSASASEMNQWRDFAAKKKAEKPDISPQDLKNAITDAIRAKMTGTDSASPANVDDFIQNAVKWNSGLYEGKERSASAGELQQWRDFAAKKKAEKPDISPSDLKNAINDAVRAKMTGTSDTSSGSVDRFIEDAVKWNSGLYEGKERSATPAELGQWRAFAAKKKAEKPDITPEQLKAAITDAIRGQMTGSSAPAGQNIEKTIKEAYAWVYSLYRGVPESTPRVPTPREMQEWQKFAQEKLKEKPDMTSADLKSLLLDSLRTALENQ
jgi:hypothetical protein